MGCTGTGYNSEFDCVVKLGQTQANKVFQQHWATWITQADIQKMASYGLNTIRIPGKLIEQASGRGSYANTPKLATGFTNLKSPQASTSLKEAGTTYYKCVTGLLSKAFTSSLTSTEHQ
jgi:aryl-phospho-beta-D-glucosidase BglC (GH1 family)